MVFTGYAGGEWRTNFRIVAAALGREQQGEKVIADYEAKVATTRGTLGAAGEQTFSIVRWQGTAPALILKELPPGQALVDLGLRRPAAQDTFGRGHSEPVSLENLQRIDADYIFFGTLGGSSVSNPRAGGTADWRGRERRSRRPSRCRDSPGSPPIATTGSFSSTARPTSTGGRLLMNRLVDDVRNALA